jgi:hypothetical protein
MIMFYMMVDKVFSLPGTCLGSCVKLMQRSEKSDSSHCVDWLLNVSVHWPAWLLDEQKLTAVNSQPHHVFRREST